MKCTIPEHEFQCEPEGVQEIMEGIYIENLPCRQHFFIYDWDAKKVKCMFCEEE